MSANPVFDEVQDLYPDVHIPDLLEVVQAWDGRPIRHVVSMPPPRDLDELVAEAQRLLRKPKDLVMITGITMLPKPDEFPAHVTRGPGPAAGSAAYNQRMLRSPKHGW